MFPQGVLMPSEMSITPANEPPLIFHVQGDVGVFTFNRPAKYNSMSLQLLDLFEDALSKIESGTIDVRVILIRATGKHFCTGADIDIVLECVKKGPESIKKWIERGQALFARIEAAPVPVVVAIQGLCLAGGLELMLACDVVLATESSRIGDQHVNFGFLPGWGSSARLPRLIGQRRALELMYSGRMLGAAEALDWGLISKVVPDDKLEEEVQTYCAVLATRSRSGLTAMKRMIRDGYGDALDAAHCREVDAVVQQLQSIDGNEGFSAFREKRKPVFK